MKIIQRKRNRSILSAALCLCLAVVIYCTLVNPSFWNMGSSLYGTKSDNFAVIWNLWTANHNETSYTYLVNFPFSRPLKTNPIDFLTVLPAVGLARVTNAVFAFNFILFLSFLLSGLFMYALIYLLTKSAIPSIIAGLAYMVLPYHLAMSQYHFTLARIEVFPLFLLALVWFLKHPRWYNVGWILLAQFISFAVNPHYGLFNFLILLVFLAVWLFYRPNKGWSKPKWARVGSAFTIAFLAAATGLPRFLSTIQKNAEVAFGKPFEQLYAYSARVWDYFLPPIQHPLLGKLTNGFIMSHIHDSYWHEQTLYLGWILLGLAGLGVWRLWRSRAPENRFLGILLPLMAMGGFLFSMPPTVEILGAQVPMPGFFLHYLFPVFRVYARFGVVVATAVVVLAGLGIAWVLERVRWKKTLGMAIGALILFEFVNIPPAHYVDLSKTPPVYEWVAQQKDVQAIAEYPLGFPPKKTGEHLNLWDVYEYMLWQRVHGKPLFNGDPSGALDLTMKTQLADPGDPNTPVRLGWLGITHLIVHKEKLDPGVIQSVEQNSNLKTVYSDEQAAVYRIVERTAHFLPDAFRYPPQVRAEGSNNNEGSVTLQVPGDNEETLIVYGPYIALPEGRYSVRFMLSQAEESASHVRLVVTTDNGRTALAEKKVLLTAEPKLVLEFRTEGAPNVEFRVYGDIGSFQFGGVTVIQGDVSGP